VSDNVVRIGMSLTIDGHTEVLDRISGLGTGECCEREKPREERDRGEEHS
jgi:hypothetical protein